MLAGRVLVRDWFYTFIFSVTKTSHWIPFKITGFGTVHLDGAVQMDHDAGEPVIVTEGVPELDLDDVGDFLWPF